MQLEYTAPKYVHDVIAALGRTEAIKFSPDNRRLAVLSFLKNKIAIFELSIAALSHTLKITITDVFEVSSTYLKHPHGVDFINDEKIIVANRDGDATIFELPSGEVDRHYELLPVEVIRSGDLLDTPSAVSLIRKNQDLYEALICNNFGHKVTKHLIDLTEGCIIKSNEILLKKWLTLPDGISVSEQWIAISNHDSHNILLYDNSISLNELSNPDGILRCVRYPHGLQFTSDGNFILVADAGAPYVHIYRKDNSGWRGVRKPLKSFRVLKDEDFLRGRDTHTGGPKGIDIDNSMSIFVTTCEVQPLAFFDLGEILEGISLVQEDFAHGLPGSGETLDADQRRLELEYELDTSPYLQDDLKVEITKLINSRSWRITAPYRWVGSLLRNLT